MPADEIRPKPVPYRFIKPEDAEGVQNEWYKEKDNLIAQYHSHLVEFRIGLMWKRGWKPDKDGKLILGMARKASESDRQIHGYHGMIYLNEEFYHEPQTTHDQKIAVLDHELCHFAPEKDKNGDTRKDEDGEPCIRVVRHDLEEFECIVNRRGLYTQAIQRMAGEIFRVRERERQEAARHATRNNEVADIIG
jgi:hypothetical protein